MASLIRTDLPTVLLALQSRLVDALSLGAERVLMSADAETPDYDPDGDYYLVIRPQDTRGDQKGGGRFDARVRQGCVLTVRSRLALDDPATHTLWLTDSTRGHGKYVHDVLDVIEGRLLSDADGNLLLHETMEVRQASRAERSPRRDGWGHSDHRFDLCFTLDLTLAGLTDL